MRSSFYSLSDSRVTTAVHVPADRVGLIIGKSGSTIRTLQEQSGAQILVPPPSPNPMSTRTITITGGEDQVSYCKALIEVGPWGRKEEGGEGEERHGKERNKGE